MEEATEVSGAWTAVTGGGDCSQWRRRLKSLQSAQHSVCEAGRVMRCRYGNVHGLEWHASVHFYADSC